MSRYRFAGDIVSSKLDLSLVSVEPAGQNLDHPCDVTVEVSTSAELAVPAMSTLFYRGEMDGGTWALGPLTDDDGWGMVFGRGCVATMSGDRSSIELVTLPSAPDEWVAEVIVGWALVFRLAVGGRSTFHGSAVTRDGESAVIICGPGGSGKSTMAAATVALGGSLIADDVLAPVRTPDGIDIPNTSSAMKLRGAAQRLGRQIGQVGSVTFDDRLSIQAVRPVPRCALRSMFFLDPAAPSGIHPLPHNDVVLKLIENSKVGVWAHPSGQMCSVREFETACELADAVPGFTLGRSVDATSVDEFTEIAASLFER